MLEEIASQHFDEVVHRLENRAKTSMTLDDIRVSKHNMREIQQIATNSGIEIEARLTRAFEQVKLPRTRFTNGDFRVLYTALDEETALSEITYHFSPAQRTGKSTVFYFDQVTYRVSGEMKDLREHLQKMPFLNDPDVARAYPHCNQVGLEAKTLNLDALFTMSARRKEGVCVPIFRRAVVSASGSRIQATVEMKFNAETGAVVLGRQATA